MLKRITHFAFLTLLLAGSACAGPSSEDMKDPNKEAEYKRNHRAEGYREGQSSQPAAS